MNEILLNKKISIERWYLFTAFRGGAVTPVNRQEVGLKFDAKPCILKAS